MDLGMQKRTNPYTYSGRKNTVVCQRKISFFFCSLLVFWGLLFTPVVLSESPMYVPSIPKGTSFGFVGVEYDYTIVTMNPESYWMIDWGDGTNTSWLQLEANNTSITQTHQWNNPGVYQLHVKYKGETTPFGVWSDPMVIEITTISMDDFPNKPIIQTAKIQGRIWETYTYSAMSKDPYGYQVSYRFDNGNGTLSDWTAFVPSGSCSYQSFAWQQPGKYYLRAQAKNQYGLESEWSNPMQVIIRNTEESNRTSVDFVLLNDVSYHIMFSSEYQGTLYNPSTGSSNDIHWNGAGVFLIDDDSDGRWEYIYIPALGQIQPYIEPVHLENAFLSQLPWRFFIIIGGIILGVIGVVFVLIKKGVIYFYEEEVVVEEE